MVCVETAWEAVASTPKCILWLDITDAGMLLCWRAIRLTPTRSSPFSPLWMHQTKVLKALTTEWDNLTKSTIQKNKDCIFKYMNSLNTLRTQRNHQQPISWKWRTYSIQLSANAYAVDLFIESSGSTSQDFYLLSKRLFRAPICTSFIWAKATFLHTLKAFLLYLWKYA